MAIVTPQYNLQVISPHLAREWHPSRNGNLTPRNVTSKSGMNVWWVCNKGHEWQNTVKNRNRGTGCPYCAGRISVKAKVPKFKKWICLGIEPLLWYPSQIFDKIVWLASVRVGKTLTLGFSLMPVVILQGHLCFYNPCFEPRIPKPRSLQALSGSQMRLCMIISTEAGDRLT